MAGLEGMLLVLGLAAGCSIFVGLGLRGLVRELVLVRRMGELGPARQGGPWAKALWRPLGMLVIGGDRERREVEQLLHAAGYYAPSAVTVFGWMRLGLAGAVWVVVAVALIASGHGSDELGPYLPWAGAGAAFLLSKRLLGWSASRRRRRIEAELPFLLDMLSMMLESGVSLDQSLRILASADGQATRITRIVLAGLVVDLERGMAYGAALDRWAARLGVSGARELAALFNRNLVHGAELSAALAGFIREFSDRRVSAAREAVGRKAAQMAIAMIFFFMPALMIVLAGPAVESLLGALTGLGR